MADFDSSLPVETRTGKYCEIKISDGVDIADVVDEGDDISVNDNGLIIYGKKRSDDTALPFEFDDANNLYVNIGAAAGVYNVQGNDVHDDAFDSNPVGIGLEYETVAGLNTVNAAGDISRIKGGAQGVLYVDLIDQEDGLRVGVKDGAAVAANQRGFLALGTDGANYQVLSTTAGGVLDVELNAGTAIAGKVYITDGVDDVAVVDEGDDISAATGTDEGIIAYGRKRSDDTAMCYHLDDNGNMYVNIADLTETDFRVEGEDAHDDAFDANPVGIGAEYETVAGLTTVNAAGDISRVKCGAEGVLYVDLLDPSNGKQLGVADGAVVAAAQLGFLALGTDGANYQVLSVDAGGQIQTAHDAQGNPVFAEITDGANEVEVAVDGAAAKTKGIQVLGTDGVNAQIISTDSNGYVNVNVVSEVSPTQVEDYDTAAAVGGGANSTHTYNNATGGNVYIHTVEGAASGAMKIEVKIGAAAAEVTKAVGFTSMANPTVQLFFVEPLICANGHNVLVVRTNREAVAMDVYSFINGFA